MQIFASNRDPEKAANAVVHPKHKVKMCLETTQILYAAHHIVHGKAPRESPNGGYGLTHKNHPCIKWAAASLCNYLWLCRHGLALCKNYTEHYRRVHACEMHIEFLYKHPIRGVPIRLTQFALAIRDEELSYVARYDAANRIDVLKTYAVYVSLAEASARMERNRKKRSRKKY